MIPITVVIPVKNEEANLSTCLETLNGFKDIVVVDSGSTDKTVDIAKHHGAKVLDFRWNGKFPKKRNWTLRNYEFKTDWVLFLDADEFPTEEFKSEISQAIENNHYNGYWLSYRNYFQNRLMKHGVPFKKLALFRVGSGEYEKIEESSWSSFDMEIHEHPIIKGNIGVVTSPIVHKEYKGLHHYISKHNEYSSWESRRYISLIFENNDSFSNLTSRQKKKYKYLARWWFAPVYFFQSYVINRGFLDGREGFVFSALKAVYFFQIKCKIDEIQGKKAI